MTTPTPLHTRLTQPGPEAECATVEFRLPNTLPVAAVWPQAQAFLATLGLEISSVYQEQPRRLVVYPNWASGAARTEHYARDGGRA